MNKKIRYLGVYPLILAIVIFLIFYFTLPVGKESFEAQIWIFLLFYFGMLLGCGFLYLASKGQEIKETTIDEKLLGKKVEFKGWETYKQFLIIIPGFGIGLLVWFWVSKIAGLSLWLGIFLAVLITIIYEILACKYELHFLNMKKIVTIAIILGLLVFGATFVLGSGEFIKEFHVTTIAQNNMDEQSLMLFSKGGGGCVSPGARGATITSTFSTWCFPDGKFDVTITAYSGCGIPSSENILKSEHFSLPLYPNDTDVTFVFVLNKDGNISVERQ